MTLLGQSTEVPQHYAPEILDPISRQLGRDTLGLDATSLPFHGEDSWNAWELAWLDDNGAAHAGVARLVLPCTSPNLIESKSLKLYLHSLNQSHFKTAHELEATLVTDLSAVAGAAVAVEVLSLDSPLLGVTALPGECIDGLACTEFADGPSMDLLRGSEGEGEQVLHSHLLRSLCPITAQPDWATVIVHCSGRQLVPESLLDYINAYRQHQEFHEQCVERIYCDILGACKPTTLSVQALYTRRGGLDINPFRSSEAVAAPRLRSIRQ
jgi:7-cyano-7-deazaguanine reductase